MTVSPRSSVIQLPPWFTPGAYWAFRMALLAAALAECVIALFRPSSPNYWVIRHSGNSGVMLMSAALACTVALLLDLLVNDLLPPRFKLRCALRWRHALLLAMAFAQLAMCAAFLTYSPSEWAYLARFFPPAAFFALAAYLDTFARGVLQNE